VFRRFLRRWARSPGSGARRACDRGALFEFGIMWVLLTCLLGCQVVARQRSVQYPPLGDDRWIPYVYILRPLLLIIVLVVVVVLVLMGVAYLAARL